MNTRTLAFRAVRRTTQSAHNGRSPASDTGRLDYLLYNRKHFRRAPLHLENIRGQENWVTRLVDVGRMGM